LNQAYESPGKEKRKDKTHLIADFKAKVIIWSDLLPFEMSDTFQAGIFPVFLPASCKQDE
jgi:hypothetical protein